MIFLTLFNAFVYKHKFLHFFALSKILKDVIVSGALSRHEVLNSQEIICYMFDIIFLIEMKFLKKWLKKTALLVSIKQR